MENGRAQGEVITISDDDDCPPQKVRRMSRSSQQQASGSSDDIIILNDDASARVNTEDGHFSDHLSDGNEGKTLGAMRNVFVLPHDWSSTGIDVRGKRIVVFGEDIDAIKQGEENGAQSVAVFKQFPARGIEANVFALAQLYVRNQSCQVVLGHAGRTLKSLLHVGKPIPASQVSRSEKDSFPVLIKQIDTKQEGVERLQAVQVRRVAGGKLEEVGKKEFPCDLLLMVDDHLDLTTECYALSSFQALYRP